MGRVTVGACARARARLALSRSHGRVGTERRLRRELSFLVRVYFSRDYKRS